MFGISDLKATLNLTLMTVSCPVRGCKNTVPRQRRGDTFRSEQFFSEEHKIYISPSTFEYAVETDNLLWTTKDDLALLNQIKQPGIKRENRIARDNSEDAVTWNVFRFLERKGMLKSLWISLGAHQSQTAPR